MNREQSVALRLRMKEGNHWYVIVLHGERTIATRSGSKVYTCGDEQGWPLDQVESVVREVRL